MKQTEKIKNDIITHTKPKIKTLVNAIKEMNEKLSGIADNISFTDCDDDSAEFIDKIHYEIEKLCAQLLTEINKGNNVINRTESDNHIGEIHKLVKSDKIYSAEEYVRSILNEEYIKFGTDDLKWIEMCLENEGLQDELWSFELIEIDEIVENKHDVILVKLHYLDINNNVQTEYRWFQVPDDFVPVYELHTHPVKNFFSKPLADDDDVKEVKKIVSIDFYWDDLTKEKQNEILELLGENCNWDSFPFYTLEIEEDDI